MTFSSSLQDLKDSNEPKIINFKLKPIYKEVTKDIPKELPKEANREV